MWSISECRAIIFDMDGLMLDTERLALKAWQLAGTDFGFPISDDIFISMVGRNRRDSDCTLVEIFGSDFPIGAVRDRYRAYLDGWIDKDKLSVKSGLLELLSFLDKISMPKAVATSTEYERAIHKLSLTNLLDHFPVVIAGDQIQKGKPAPDIFLAAAAQLGVLPEGCLVLEDSDTGIQAAYDAGMTPVMIPDMKPPSEKSLAFAHRIFGGLGEFHDYFREGLELI
jgi:beta-phosphoglucomutase-like phosphatase (HAD superfamily)